MNTLKAFQALQNPAAERNKEPLRQALAPMLPRSGRLLELASGALQHALHIAPQHPGLIWQCSELNEQVLALAPNYIAALGEHWPSNVQAPVPLDAANTPWDQPRLDVIFTANLLHISPFTVTQALFSQAAVHLQANGLLLIYGPFKHHDRFQSEGDAQFDASLRSRNPQWGIRSREALEQLAVAAGLQPEEAMHMPANNWLLAFRQSARNVPSQ